MGKQSNRPIWSKADVEGPSESLAAYCAGRDVVGRPPADADLIEYDLWTNRAHCLMLQRCGIISERDLGAILGGLDVFERHWRTGGYELDPRLEDVHMNIERAVAGVGGEHAAGQMHTGRSRNDQSATDVRLWLRDRLLDRLRATLLTIDALWRLARRHLETICPGWTHGQPAMPTTLGHWAAAHGWALLRDCQALKALWPVLNTCPLGSAASFGTSWPINRRMTARLLGFDAPQPNSLDAISNRGEVEARLGFTLSILMTHLSSLGQDLIFMTTPPRRGLRLSDAHVSGSSIMPQKRNPDFAEVTRARAQAVLSMAGNLAAIGRGALSGYNRDVQWTKYWIMELVAEFGQAPEVFAEVVGGLQVDGSELARAAAEGFSSATDLADHLARTRRIPFRRAYHVVGAAAVRDQGKGWITLESINERMRQEGLGPLFTREELAECSRPDRAVRQRASQGGPAPEQVRCQLDALRENVKQIRRWANGRDKVVRGARCRAWRPPA